MAKRHTTPKEESPKKKRLRLKDVTKPLPMRELPEIQDITVEWLEGVHKQIKQEEKLQETRDKIAHDVMPKDGPKALKSERGQHKVFDLQRQRDFAIALAQHDQLSSACKEIGVAYSTVVHYLKHDPIFQALIKEAKNIYRDHVAAELRRRAIEGYEKPIFGGQFKDQIVGYERVYSDRLLELEAKRVDPSYREGKGAGSLDINVREGGVLVIQQTQAKPEEWVDKYGKEVVDITPL